jgi:hypothetical protein
MDYCRAKTPPKEEYSYVSFTIRTNRTTKTRSLSFKKGCFGIKFNANMLQGNALYFILFYSKIKSELIMGLDHLRNLF